MKKHKNNINIKKTKNKNILPILIRYGTANYVNTRDFIISKEILNKKIFFLLNSKVLFAHRKIVIFLLISFPNNLNKSVIRNIIFSLRYNKIKFSNIPDDLIQSIKRTTVTKAEKGHTKYNKKIRIDINLKYNILPKNSKSAVLNIYKSIHNTTIQIIKKQIINYVQNSIKVSNIIGYLLNDQKIINLTKIINRFVFEDSKKYYKVLSVKNKYCCPHYSINILVPVKNFKNTHLLIDQLDTDTKKILLRGKFKVKITVLEFNYKETAKVIRIYDIKQVVAVEDKQGKLNIRTTEEILQKMSHFLAKKVIPDITTYYSAYTNYTLELPIKEYVTKELEMSLYKLFLKASDSPHSSKVNWKKLNIEV